MHSFYLSFVIFRQLRRCKYPAQANFHALWPTPLTINIYIRAYHGALQYKLVPLKHCFLAIHQNDSTPPSSLVN